MSNTYLMIKGVELNFAKLDKPVNPFGTLQYEVQIATDSAEKAKELEGMGLNVKQRDGKFIVALKRKAKKADGSDNTPVTVFDAALNEMSSEKVAKIGNGSVGSVKVYAFDYEFNGKKGTSFSLTAVQITDYKEYTGGNSAASGFDIEMSDDVAEDAAGF